MGVQGPPVIILEGSKVSPQGHRGRVVAFVYDTQRLFRGGLACPWRQPPPLCLLPGSRPTSRSGRYGAYTTPQEALDVLLHRRPV
jgi:hypothetical protein